MEIYIDESGHTGKIKDINILKDLNTTYFSIGIIAIKDNIYKNNLENKYRKFKLQYQTAKKKNKSSVVIKGNKLVKDLEWTEKFINEILDNNFSCCIIDKKFLIAAEITEMLFLWENTKLTEKYIICQYLCKNIELLSKYFQLIKNINDNEIIIFIKYLLASLNTFDCENTIKEIIKKLCNKIINGKKRLKIINQKIKPKIIPHVISLKILLDNDKRKKDLIFSKLKKKEEIKIFHDEQEQEVENEITNLFTNYLGKERHLNFSIDFIKSNNIFIQIADNFISVFNCLVRDLDKIIYNKEKYEENFNKLKIISLLGEKIQNNINNFVSLDKKPWLPVINYHFKDNCKPINFDTLNSAINDGKKQMLEQLSKEYKIQKN